MLAACGGDKGAPADSAAAPAAEPAAAPAAAAPAAAAAPSTEQLVAIGKEKYGQICATCHQQNGQGLEGNFPPLAGSTWLLGNAEVPISIVLNGLQGESEVNGKKYNGIMSPWNSLSDEEIAGVLTYVRQEWGNAAPPVLPADVNAVRTRLGERGMWTAEELKKTYPGAGT